MTAPAIIFPERQEIVPPGLCGDRHYSGTTGPAKDLSRQENESIRLREDVVGTTTT